MTARRLRQASKWTTFALVALIVMLTLFVSPAQGDSLDGLLPGGFLIGSETEYDACIGGIHCRDAHALAFVALGMSLTVQMLRVRRGARTLVSAAGVLLILIAFAAADEFAQRWVGRDPSLDDWLADIAGGLLGLVLGEQAARTLVRE